MDIYLNGQFHPPGEARVSVEDAGFQHAVGLFETFAAYHGRAFRLDQHLARLEASAIALGLVRELDKTALRDAVEQTIAHNRIDRARLRLTYTAGEVSMRRDAPGRAEPTPTVAIVPSPPTQYDPAYFEHGVQVVLYNQSANPFDPVAGHKTLAYWARLRSLRQAAGVGAAEAVWLSVTNHLTSGAVSNLFLVRDGALLTPIARGEELESALPAPVLPGITRAAIIELAEAEGITVTRQMISAEDLLGAEEAFLTNSGWGVLPVTRVEKAKIADGRVGPMTTGLREALNGLIERECGG